MRWACVVLLSLTVALVPPAARLSRHVCGGAAYDYCVQALGCTTAEASKVEGKAFAEYCREHDSRACGRTM